MLKSMVGIGLAAVIGTAGFLDWASISNIWKAPRDVAVRERLVAQWQAMDLMDRSVAQRPSPADWSAGAFIGNAALNSALDALEGARLEYVPKDKLLSGTTLVLDSIDVRPELGRMEADLAISARKGDLVLKLKATALISFRGTERANDDAVQALFRIEPVLVQPSVEFGIFHFGLRDFWARLVPDLAVAFLNPDAFVVRLPLADTMRVTLKVKQEATEPLGGSAKISYLATLPESTIVRRVSYSTPIVSPGGLWLFGILSDAGQEALKVSDPPTRDPAVLKTAIEALEGSLKSKLAEYSKVPSAALAVRVNKAVFVALGNDIAALPADKRRVDVRSTRSEGRLTETNWHNDLLGDGGAFAELNGGDGLKGSIQFGKPSVGWSNGRLALTLPATLASEASVHVHFDPLIGGGVGTVIGMNGNGSADITGTALPLLMNKDGLRAVLLQPDLQCKLVEAVVESDGRLKIDLGWTKVPSIGAKFQVPIGREAMTPTPLFDGRPQFVEIPAVEPRADEVAEKPWRFVPAHRALKIALNPIAADGDDNGIVFAAEVAIAPIQADTADAVERARSAVAVEASSYAARVAEAASSMRPAKACSLNPGFAVLLGGIEFGPNNEIVKFARNAWHDLTQGPGPNNELRKLVEGAGDAADHAAKEAEKSVNKVITNPGGAVQDFGHQLFNGFR